MNEFVNNKRISWIDFCRGLGMLFILLGHTSFPHNKIIYGFHVPLFFMISGILCAEGECKYGRSVCKYAKKYIVPYFAYETANLILDILYHGFRNYPIKNKIIGIVYSRGTVKWMPNCSPLWFLTCLFITMCILGVIKRIKNKVAQGIVVSLCMITSYLLDYFNAPKLIWNIDTAMMAVHFAWLGNKEKEWIYTNNRYEVYYLGIVGIIAIILNPIATVDFNNNTYGNLLLMVIGALGVSSLLIKLSCLFGNYKNIVVNYTKWIGKNTVFFMAFDYLFGRISINVLNMLGCNTWYFVFCLKLILLSISCYITKIFKRKYRHNQRYNLYDKILSDGC